MMKRVVLLMLGLSFCSLALAVENERAAAQKEEKHAANDDDDDDKPNGAFWGWGGQGYYRNGKMSKTRELLQLLKKLPDVRRQVNQYVAELKQEKEGKSPEEQSIYDLRIEAYRSGLRALEDELTKQSTFGRAIARGLAGNEWKAIEDESVKDIWSGLALGLALRTSNEAGNVLGKRIANSVDRVAGGTWDYLINKLVDAWNALGILIWPHTSQRFDTKELLGWRDHLKNCFDAIDRLLKDGLKDSLRGKDSTLRKVDETTTVEETQTVNVWRILIDGYVRQIDFIVTAIDEHLEAYKEAMIPEPQVVLYAQELRRRLVEFQGIIVKPKNLKDLDSLLDSNKTLVLALRQNIESLLIRLICAVEPTTGNGGIASKVSNVSKVSSGDDDDNKFPGTFRNW